MRNKSLYVLFSHMLYRLSSVNGDTEAREGSAVWPGHTDKKGERGFPGRQVGVRACKYSHAPPCLFFLLASCGQCRWVVLLLVPTPYLSIITPISLEGFLRPCPSKTQRRSLMSLSSLFQKGLPLPPVHHT